MEAPPSSRTSLAPAKHQTRRRKPGVLGRVFRLISRLEWGALSLCPWLQLRLDLELREYILHRVEDVLGRVLGERVFQRGRLPGHRPTRHVVHTDGFKGNTIVLGIGLGASLLDCFPNDRLLVIVHLDRK